MKLRRGDIWLAAIPGDYGKVRPQLIIQSELLNMAAISSVLVCPLTTEIQPDHFFRLTLLPAPTNGLMETSQVMADKITAISRERLKKKIGAVSYQALRQLGTLCATAIGIYDANDA